MALNPNSPLYIRAVRYPPPPPLPPPPPPRSLLHQTGCFCYHCCCFNDSYYPYLPPPFPFSYQISYYHVPPPFDAHKPSQALHSTCSTTSEVREEPKQVAEVIKEEGHVEKSEGESSRSCKKLGSPNFMEKWRKNGKLIKKENTFSSSDHYEFKEEEAAGRGASKTTVMIKNIPNKFDKQMVLDLLDKHCREVNENVEGDGDAAVPLSEFDFLYLPIDFRTGSNLGYAFVNFTTPIAAWRLFRELHKKTWGNFGSGKICEVTYARIQGLPALLSHFSHSTFICESGNYLPVHFTPSRDGCRLTKEKLVGKFIPKRRRA